MHFDRTPRMTFNKLFEPSKPVFSDEENPETPRFQRDGTLTTNPRGLTPKQTLLFNKPLSKVGKICLT